jgi:hypothetical protein
MSDISPASYIDDGFDFDKRVLEPSGINVAKWLHSLSINDGASTVVKACSYFDDGADLLPRSDIGPGFGRPNSKYNEPPPPKQQSKKYHPGVQRAVGGQISNVLASMRAVGEFTVKRPENGDGTLKADKKENEKEENDKGENGPPSGAVRIWIPPPPPNFVIHGEDGHVIVVDDTGEPIDSRPPPELKARVRKPVQRGDTSKEKGSERRKKVEHGFSQRDRQAKEKEQQENQNQRQDTKTASNALADIPAKQQEKRPSEPASHPDFWMSGGLAIPSPPRSESTWKNTQVGSNYHAPTVEDASDTPSKKREYKNGYDEDYGTYCNANWGGIPVRVGEYKSPIAWD